MSECWVKNGDECLGEGVARGKVRKWGGEGWGWNGDFNGLVGEGPGMPKQRGKWAGEKCVVGVVRECAARGEAEKELKGAAGVVVNVQREERQKKVAREAL